MHAKDAWLKSLSVLPLSSSHDEKGSDWPEFLSVERVAELQFPATDQDGPTASEVKDKQGELILAMRHSVDSGQLYVEYDTTLAETEVAVLDSNGESRLVKGMGTVEVCMLPAQVLCDWLRERGLTPSEHLAAWFGSMKVQERSLPNRDMPDLWSEKTASIRPPKEVPRRFAERDFLEGFEPVTVRMAGENGRSPISRKEAPAEQCAEIATYQQLDVGDWISLTGVGIGKHGRYRITPDSVKFIAWTDEEIGADGLSTEDQQAMWQDNKAPSLDFPCTPDNLLTFIESLAKSNAGDGTFFEVPDAFKNAVAAQQRAPLPSEPEAVTQGSMQTVSEEGRGDAEPEQIAGLALPTTRTHRLKPRVGQLDAVIERAKQQAIDPKDYHSVWAALVNIAESERPPPLCGYSSDGIQYKGKQYEESGVPDVFTKVALRLRMSRSAQ